MRIPLYDELGRKECDASPARIERLLSLYRVTVVKDRHGRIVRAFMRDMGGRPGPLPTAHMGQKYSFNQLLGDGHKAWKHKTHAPANDHEADCFVRRIFRLSVLDNLVAA